MVVQAAVWKVDIEARLVEAAQTECMEDMARSSSVPLADT